MSSYARVITYEYRPDTLKAITQKVRDGLLPLLQKSSGFLSYVRVLEKENRGIAIATWQTREQAEAATNQATQWLKDNTGEFAIRLDTYVGEVILEASMAEMNKAVV